MEVWVRHSVSLHIRPSNNNCTEWERLEVELLLPLMEETRTARAQAALDALAISAVLGSFLVYALYEIDTRFMGGCGWVLVYPGMFYWTWRQYMKVKGWGSVIVAYTFATLPLVGIVHCFHWGGCPIHFVVLLLILICMFLWVCAIIDKGSL